MHAGADAIVDSGASELGQGGDWRVGGRGRVTVEFPHGGCQEGRLEFSGRIGPSVLFGRLDEKRTRSDQGEKMVLVDRQGGFPVIELFIGCAEPMRKLIVDGADGFAFPIRKNGAREGGSGAAGAVGDDGGKPGIACSGVQGGLPETGMPPDGDGSDEIRQFFEQVHATAKRP